MKNAILLTVLVISMIGVGGCAMNKNYGTEMLSNLENKYGEKFESVIYHDTNDKMAQAYGGGDKMYVNPVLNKKLIFQVERNNEEKTFIDNYEAIKDSEIVTEIVKSKFTTVSPKVLDVRAYLFDPLLDAQKDGLSTEEFVIIGTGDRAKTDLNIYLIVKVCNDSERYELLQSFKKISLSLTQRDVRVLCTFVDSTQEELAIRSNILAVSDDANWPHFENDGTAWYNSFLRTTDEEMEAQIKLHE